MKNSAHLPKIKALVIPLNWGLGHATRLIPVISELQKMNVSVIAGGSPVHQKLFQQQFAGLETIDFPHLNIRLTGKRTQVFSLAFQVPAFLFQICREHRALKRVIKEKEIDIVISDNCYGLWNPSVYSVFITHQLHIKLPSRLRVFRHLINRMNTYFIRKFDECWVPDIPEMEGFAGKLSHTNNSTAKYIGILSRFNLLNKAAELQEHGSVKRILFILSGPEKQRNLFEECIRKEIAAVQDEFDYTVIRGLPDHNKISDEKWINHADMYEMASLISRADMIVCRAGYSTIMDLISLGRTAVLIPTPGQTEQEYLADFLEKKGYFLTYLQKEFRLKTAIPDFTKFRKRKKPISTYTTNTFLTDALKNLPALKA